MAAGADVSTVNKILILQVVVLLITVAVFFMTGGWGNARSPGLGGLIALLANFLFAFCVQLARNKSPRQMLHYFYIGEAAKIFLTVVLFIVFVQIPGIQFLTLLIGYAIVLSVHWFALIIWRNL
jgi:ATP synthase protein I